MIHQSFIVWIIIQGISLNHDYDYHLRCSANLEDGIPVFRFLSSCSYPLSLMDMVLPQSVVPFAAYGHLLWRAGKGQCWKLCWLPLGMCPCITIVPPTRQVRGTTHYYYGRCEDAYRSTSHVSQSPFTSFWLSLNCTPNMLESFFVDTGQSFGIGLNHTTFKFGSKTSSYSFTEDQIWMIILLSWSSSSPVFFFLALSMTLASATCRMFSTDWRTLCWLNVLTDWSLSQLALDCCYCQTQ